MPQMTITTLAQTPTSDQLLTGSSPTVASGTTATQGTPGAAPLPSQAPANPSLSFLLPIALAFGAVMLISVFARRKESKQRTQLIDSLKRGDQVLTAGGIIGSIAEIRDDYIMLRVDEHSNSKIKVTRAAITQNLTARGGAAATTAQVEVKTKNGAPEKDAVGA